MKIKDRGNLIIASLLIGAGVLLLLFNIIPGMTFAVAWPVLLFLLTAGFFLPALIWPYARQGLAALFVPGTMFFVLGIIFLYNTLTQDWMSWAYIWVLLPGSLGIGLVLAAWAGGWDHRVKIAGVWISVISLAVFSLLATAFGSPLLRLLGPILLIAGGILLLLRSFFRTPPA